MSADYFLPRLKKVCKTDPDSWKASCLAQNDDGVSLSSRESKLMILRFLLVFLKANPGCTPLVAYEAVKACWDAQNPGADYLTRDMVMRKLARVLGI